VQKIVELVCFKSSVWICRNM